jgi:hypothetical protein
MGIASQAQLSLDARAFIHSERQRQQDSMRFYSSTGALFQPSPFSQSEGKRPKKKSKFIPRKAAVKMTEQARTFFKTLLESNPEKAGVLLNYDQSSTGEPRMVFSFDFVAKDGISPMDEG